MNDIELKPCPFCGVTPVFDEVGEIYGTYFEYSCDCGLVSISLQICDFMTVEERIYDGFENHKYGDRYCERALNEAIRLWNTRKGE